MIGSSTRRKKRTTAVAAAKIQLIPVTRRAARLESVSDGIEEVGEGSRRQEDVNRAHIQTSRLPRPR